MRRWLRENAPFLVLLAVCVSVTALLTWDSVLDMRACRAACAPEPLRWCLRAENFAVCGARTATVARIVPVGDAE